MNRYSIGLRAETALIVSVWMDSTGLASVVRLDGWSRFGEIDILFFLGGLIYPGKSFLFSLFLCFA